MAGQTVEFKWDMPGPALAETKTATTEADGTAKVDVVSGDELSKDYDEKTHELLFDEPVEVTATCTGAEDTKKLDVLAPSIEWQYKNEGGNYVPWHGEVWGLYSFAHENGQIPLRAVLTFDNLPVVGHPVRWGFRGIYDKGGAEVLSNEFDYRTYGHMSGAISTTTADGRATATFMNGYNFGQIIFAIEDASITVTATEEGSGLSGQALRLGDAPDPGEIALSSRKSVIDLTSPTLDEYKWVKGIAAYQNQWGYPAPSGSEDNELLDETRRLVREDLNRIDPEFKTHARKASSGTRGWFIAQAVGNDPDSAGYHFADLKTSKMVSQVVKSGKKKGTKEKVKATYRYSAAFDIVLTHVPVFVPHGRRYAFAEYVKAMRDDGIVAWHRWAGEDYDGNAHLPGGSFASVQNEMHCIDPAYPIIKSGLLDQIERFRVGGSGGDDYDPDPHGWTSPFGIDPFQIQEMERRETIVRRQFAKAHPNAKPANN